MLVGQGIKPLLSKRKDAKRMSFDAKPRADLVPINTESENANLPGWKPKEGFHTESKTPPRAWLQKDLNFA